MSEYFETVAIIFCEVILADFILNAVYKTLKYIWEKLK